VSVEIAASHAHRAHALDATRYVIEQLKTRVPIWNASTKWTERASDRSVGALARGTVQWTAVTLKDQFGRSIEYLRISITDRCNFRCVYACRSKDFDGCRRAEILSYEEITEVVRQLAPLGLRRLRITGGEPTILVRSRGAHSHAEGDSRHRGHRALNERREASRTFRGSCARRARPRKHQRGFASRRSDRGNSAAKLSVRSCRVGAGRRDAG